MTVEELPLILVIEDEYRNLRRQALTLTL